MSHSRKGNLSRYLYWSVTKINFQRWYIQIRLVVEDFELEIVALVDSGADVNCIRRINSNSLL